MIAAWLKNEPDKPDAYIAAANYYANKASGIGESTKPAEQGDLVVVDPKTGKAVGSLYNTINPQIAKTAMEYLRQALEKFPQRLDIWFGLASLQEKFGDFNGELLTLKEMVRFAKANVTILRNYKGEPLSTDANKLLPEKLHDYATYYYEKKTAADDEKMVQIARLSAESYPGHDYAFNDIAAYYSNKGDFKNARLYFEKALNANSKDTLVLLNLGDVCVKLKDIKKAREYYERVVQIDPKSEDATSAREALQQSALK